MKHFSNCYCEKPANILNDCLKKKQVSKSTLFNFAKLFENIIYSQLNDYMEKTNSQNTSGFRKKDGTQNSLLRMIESWKAKFNNGSKVVVIIMELSKAFDSLNHDLSLSKTKGIWFR